MTEPLFIYVAGPYTPRGNDIHDAAREANLNVRVAIQIGIELIKKGHFAFIPHLTHFIHLEMGDNIALPNTFWYEYDLKWLAKCNALYYIAPSTGANIELKWAREHGLQVFHELHNVPDVSKK